MPHGQPPRRRARGKQAAAQREGYRAMVAREANPDPKPSGRYRNQKHLDEMRPPYANCPLCGNRFDRYPGGTRHHVIPKSQGGDDLATNIVWLCGDGTRGCHGLIEAGDRSTRVRLRGYLERDRPDVIRYVTHRIAARNRAPLTAGLEWLDARYPRTYDPRAGKVTP